MSPRPLAHVDAQGPRGARRGQSDDQVLRIGLVLISVYLIGISLLAFFLPGMFFEGIGPFGPRNDHYTRDAATFQVVLGISVLVAVQRVGWRVPVLVLSALQFGLHSVSHFIDFHNADPKWLGPPEAFALLLSAFGLGYLAARAGRKGEPR